MKRVTKGALVVAAVSALSLSTMMAQDRTSAERASASTRTDQRFTAGRSATNFAFGQQQQGYRITPDGVNGWTTRRSATGWNKNQSPGIWYTLRSWLEQ
jgi:hypothetical protein